MRHQFWVDRGGTFTDCIHRDPESGELRVTKVLSSDRAPLVAIRQLLGLAEYEAIPPSDIRMGTTVAVNALLERRGQRVALLITRGFGDLLEIGDQTRPSLFDLDIVRPELLYERVLEIEARCTPDGRVAARDDAAVLSRQLAALKSDGIRSLAVAVKHAYANAELEREIAALASAHGFSHVALSHDVAPEIGFLARTATTVLDAYLTPLLSSYLARLGEELPGSRIRLMQSSGGLGNPRTLRARDALLSGPAGGVVACAAVARQAGVARVIGFDMGGTSTDVSRFAGQHELVFERQIAGITVRAPMLDLHTVAAGGGSICSFDGQRFRVGPESAGADPGPLCYGRASARHLTVTDLNLALGRLQPDLFPFGLDRERALAALRELSHELSRAGHLKSPEQVARGFLQIANANMAEAVAKVSVARGFAARDHALIVFGGAGGQHACAVADLLGIDTILFHPLGGVLSAYGIGIAPISKHVQADAGRRPLDAALLSELTPRFEELQAGVRQAFEADHASSPSHIQTTLDLAYAGTETVLNLPLDSAEALRAEFERRHLRLFGYVRPEHPIIARQLRVEASAAPESAAPAPSPAPPASGPPRVLRHERFWTAQQDEPVLAPVHVRSELAPGHQIVGPALVLETTGSLVIEPGFVLCVEAAGLFRVTRKAATARAVHASDARICDPVLLELMGNRFMSIAEQMGHVLGRTALSTNIRERLDFSCAVFDRDANLIANAPHIPVHLGAMSETVAAIHAQHPDPAPGDVFVSNDPALGGSHLPDITVVTPVHDAHGRLTFYVASRGHHVDVGGVSPGSMPAVSHSLAEEGVVFRGERIVKAGQLSKESVLGVLGSGPYPARFPEQNLADLQAQIAANQRGVLLLLELAAEVGSEFVERYMGHILDYSARRVAAAIAELPQGVHHCADRLDDGTTVRATLSVRGERLDIDFSGSSPEHPGNLNSPRAVTLSAVLYVVRTLIREPIPLNGGCLRPVVVHIAEPSLLAAGPGRAVAAGNVETSQRIVDVLLGALGSLAASQGTMNNLTFGNTQLGYYETLAGGAGAGRSFHGASAVHTHMTNTRVTDSEVLEARYPVRVVEFSVRRGSGGRGRFAGGDGLVRELEFLAPLDVAVVSERRTTLPFGLFGGHSGAPGQNRLNGEPLPGRFALRAAVGDRLRIETPGGGGHGPPEAGNRA